MVDRSRIYLSEAEMYDQLVACEDAHGRLLPAIEERAPFRGRNVLELGTGTGRFARLVAPSARQVIALDASAHMLAVAQRRLVASGLDNWRLAVGDHRCLPLPDGLADMALAGWTLSHLLGLHAADWQVHIDRAVDEIGRVLRPGGTAVIVETLGTGREMPQPPSEGLAAYYQHLEEQRGFASDWIRTDYRFASVGQAERLIGFFFGPELAETVREERMRDVPECTGIWWRQF